jgi:hypothetical protein
MPHTHIFLDNSNIFGGAQRTALEREVKVWQCVRVDYRNLFRLLQYRKPASRTSMLAGSVPPGNEALWEAAKDAGFDTTLLRRVATDTGRLIEQGVDEAIHLRISNILLDSDEPGTMVIATGDGAETEQGCSFTQQVVRAAKRGWKVEIWSWKNQLAGRLRDTRIRFPEQVRVFKLDEWYRSIVFIKGGTYYLNSDPVEIATRTCSPLVLTDGQFADAALTLGPER